MYALWDLLEHLTGTESRRQHSNDAKHSLVGFLHPEMENVDVPVTSDRDDYWSEID